MGLFGKLKKVVNIMTLGQLTFFEKQLEISGQLVKATIDVTNEMVRVGEEVFRAVPGEVLYPGLGPLAGLLKNELEDELIFLGRSAVGIHLVPYVQVVIDGAFVVGDLTGKVQHRTMRADELRVARYVFRGTLGPTERIRLTNLAGLGGAPFVVPALDGGAHVNLGDAYVHSNRITDIPLLMHELAHVWQIQREIFSDVFLCKGAFVQTAQRLKKWVGDQYAYRAGSQWSAYGLEQQARIVEDWVRGTDPTTRRRIRPMIFAPPLFRYLNGNIRRGVTDASTAEGGSVRTWLAEGKVRAGHLRYINPPRPQAWW